MVVVIGQVVGALESAVDDISAVVESFPPHSIDDKANEEKSSDDADEQAAEDAGEESGRSDELAETEAGYN